MVVSEGYKQTEIGVIPEDWRSLLTEKILQKNTVNVKIGPFGSQLKKENLSEYGTFKVYGQENIYNNDFVIGERYIDKERFKELKTCELVSGDVVISMMGTIGHCVIVPDNIQPGIMDSHLIRIRIDTNRVSPLFIRYCIAESEFIQRQIKNLSVGGIMAGLNSNIIKQLIFIIPPLPEQKAIATALSDIDGLINSLNKLIEKKKNIKQGAMQELLTGKKKLYGFSGEWVFRTMGNLFKFSGGYSASREQLSTEGYSYLHYGDIHGSAKTFVDIKDEYLEIPKLNIELNKISKDKLLQDGDIVFVDASEDDEGVSRHVVIRNTQGIPFISGLHTIVAKNRTNELDNLYKEFCFQSQELKKQFSFYAAGIKVSGISRSNIIKIVLKIPPTIEEQTAIATILSDMDSETETLQAKLNKYKAIKQGMMQELLTGRIRLLEGA